MNLGLKFILTTLLSLSSTSAYAFTDTQNYWGRDCIQELKKRQLVSGYPDNSFRPQGTVTRAEAAVLMLNAFPDAKIKRSVVNFRDVPSNYWGYRAISLAYQKEFFAGYPNNIFQPNQAIPRAQIIGVVAGGKNYSPVTNPTQVLQQYFTDAGQIPNYARNAIAQATINSIVVNYPNPKQINPLANATRGEVAALICRALNIYTVPPQYIAGVEVQPQEVRPLPGSLNTVPTFNSNSPELVLSEGILLSTFPPEGKKVPSAHLNYGFQGRFDIFTHHIARSENSSSQTLYQGIIIHNPNNQAATVKVLQGASYLSTPEAPFITLPDTAENTQGNVYSGPGSRTMADVLRGIKQDKFPEQLVIPAKSSRILLNLPIPAPAPSSNGRTVMMRLSSDRQIYLANLAQKAVSPPSLETWQTLLDTGNLAEKRDPVPTPLDPPREPTVFSRVAGVSQGSEWQTTLIDNANVSYLTIPQPGKSFSYVLGTLHLITLGTKQIQSATMLRRYADTAYFAHSNYGVEYNLTLPLRNNTGTRKTVTLSVQTPLKDEGGTDRLLFLNPRVEQIFFRGTVRLIYTDDKGNNQTRYVHLVQRRGQPGETLVKLNMEAGTQRDVQVDFIYPPDSTPPQVLTVKTES